jgi:hypothetical protein
LQVEGLVELADNGLVLRRMAEKDAEFAVGGRHKELLVHKSMTRRTMEITLVTVSMG